MKDTAEVRSEIDSLWAKFKKGEVTANEARVHIGFARTILDTLKVEIAAAHLNAAHVPPVALTKPRVINGRAARQ
jgi:hypothetical protein